MPMYHEGVLRTSGMGLFTPKDQLRDMQQHYAAQSLLGGTSRRPDQQSMLLQSVAASISCSVRLSPSSMTTCLKMIFLDDDLTF